MKKTSWFPHQIKPARVGLYEVTAPFSTNTLYAWWDGQEWGWASSIKREAGSPKLGSTAYQFKIWRGLAAKP